MRQTNLVQRMGKEQERMDQDPSSSTAAVMKTKAIIPQNKALFSAGSAHSRKERKETTWTMNLVYCASLFLQWIMTWKRERKEARIDTHCLDLQTSSFKGSIAGEMIRLSHGWDRQEMRSFVTGISKPNVLCNWVSPVSTIRCGAGTEAGAPCSSAPGKKKNPRSA